MMRTPEDDWSDFPTRFAAAVVSILVLMAGAVEAIQKLFGRRPQAGSKDRLSGV